MSEQKYYVYDNFYGSEILIRHSNDFDVDWILEEYIEHDKEDMERCAFTKSELAKIKNGALYKEMKDVVEYRTDTLIESNTGWSFTDEIIGDIEWINPIIKLVPVEDNE